MVQFYYPTIIGLQLAFSIRSKRSFLHSINVSFDTIFKTSDGFLLSMKLIVNWETRNKNWWYDHVTIEGISYLMESWNFYTHEEWSKWLRRWAHFACLKCGYDCLILKGLSGLILIWDKSRNYCLLTWI